jgi:hypothetical protein
MCEVHGSRCLHVSRAISEPYQSAVLCERLTPNRGRSSLSLRCWLFDSRPSRITHCSKPTFPLVGCCLRTLLVLFWTPFPYRRRLHNVNDDAIWFLVHSQYRRTKATARSAQNLCNSQSLDIARPGSREYRSYRKANVFISSPVFLHREVHLESPRISTWCYNLIVRSIAASFLRLTENLSRRVMDQAISMYLYPVSERPLPVDEEPTALCQVADCVELVGLTLHQLQGVVGCGTVSVSRIPMVTDFQASRSQLGWASVMSKSI